MKGNDFMDKWDKEMGFKLEVTYGTSGENGEFIPFKMEDERLLNKLRIVSKSNSIDTQVFCGDRKITDLISHIEIKIDESQVNTAVITFNNVELDIEVDKDKVEKG